jgi:asparagine synthase (glutamine-hydrolysing)
MCGIIAVLNPTVTPSTIFDNFKKGQHRGPDHSTFEIINNSVWMGFHRLAINGLTPDSNQPFCIDGIYLVCNGEIYNYKELYQEYNIQPETESDCEIIIHLYKQFGIHETMQIINASECAFVLYDSNTDCTYAVRDTYGVRPLYHAILGTMHIFASELKMINELNITTVQHHIPSTITMFHRGELKDVHYYTSLSSFYSMTDHIEDVYKGIHDKLYNCIKRRVIATERPISCLLSGGLDSSIVTAVVKRVRDELGVTEPLETYSIGLEGAEDLKYATIMADFLGTKHTNIIVTEDDFFNAIPETIYNLESYDTTSVRASVGNIMVCKEISKRSEAKVVFNGDGSDEVTGGYLYMKKCPDAIEFDKECRRLVQNIHLFDALRSDRGPSCNGLEARTPFLDPEFVDWYLMLPPEIRFTPHCEKLLLRKAFESYLPPCIANRTKEAFSDGVSSTKRSWYQIIQEKIPAIWDLETVNMFNPPTTPEQRYYRMIFNQYYSNMENVVPYMWMPKYTTSTDCSARTLEHYEK